MRKFAGAVGLGTTLSVNVCVFVPVPSPTVIVMSALPVAPATGVTVTVRFPPEPPSTIPPANTSDELDELAVIVRLVAAVSTSLIVNGIAVVAVLTRIVSFVIAEMMGRRFTVAVKVRTIVLFAAPPSLTVTEIVAEPDAPVAAVKLNEPAAFGLV